MSHTCHCCWGGGEGGVRLFAARFGYKTVEFMSLSGFDFIVHFRGVNVVEGEQLVIVHFHQCCTKSFQLASLTCQVVPP